MPLLSCPDVLDTTARVEYTNEMPKPTNDVWEALSTARSVRRFTDEPVDGRTLDRCLEAATWAPNGANAQLWRFIVLDAAEQRAAVANAAQIALGTIEKIYGMSRPDDDDHSRMARNNRATYELHDRAGERTSVLFTAYENEFASDYLQAGSIYPAMQNFYLAARAQGLGACFTSWASYDGEHVLREAIGVPDDGSSPDTSSSAGRAAGTVAFADVRSPTWCSAIAGIQRAPTSSTEAAPDLNAADLGRWYQLPCRTTDMALRRYRRLRN